ncbi:hypothetical protein MGMO_176c00020 [Methyloglobulus morosus KoM1]|uniref:Uncharacterized protein n=1 Tax=Methyloglobulus morosus KoM1 TaxID=1116472 RepID=V5DH87_9GAMM|nr:hypothetical protein [Methyloglobulus morosus]ESS66791.1 hypothetical protein MGMO_176c00020 [Methyloglobulus morosus KoM1]
MLNINSKKILLALCFCVTSGSLSPALTQADTAIVLAAGGSGNIASGQAAEQRAAKEKKAAEKQKKAEEKKAAEVQKGKAAAK